MLNLALLTLQLVILEVKYSQSIQYSNGDIVLYLNGSHELTNKGGILQVYLYRWHDEDFPEGIWTNICSETFNRPAAAATCRQLGYIDAIDYGPYQKFHYQINPDISSYVLTGALCSTVSDYVKYGETHVLRCAYYSDIVNMSDIQSCTPVAIQCDSKLMKEYPYTGQLMLSNRSGSYQNSVSSGYLSMNHNGQWYPVCANVSYFGSISACRQLGATSVSSTYPNRSMNTMGVYVGDPSCLLDSYSCLDHCYNITTFSLTSCHTVHVVCTFLIKDGPKRSSGSLSICQYQHQASKTSESSSVAGLSVFLGIFCLTTIMLTIVITVIVFRNRYKLKGQNYDKLMT